jgi:hypothetical protein
MPARLACVLTVAALAAVAAGCGSSSSAKQATTTTPNGQRGARFAALSKCLQSKGFKLPNRGQQQPGGGRPPGLNLQDPKLRQAFLACRTQVFGNSGPQGGPPGGGPPGGGAPGGGAPYGAPSGQGGGTFQ